MMRGRRVALASIVSVLVLAGTGRAFASWNGSGTGTGWTAAASMPTGTTPSVAVSGRNVTVSWTASTVGGQGVGGYVVRRYDAGTLALQTIGSACSGLVVGLSCTEAAVPAGSWVYSVTPVRGPWTGVEGSSSATAVVGAPTMSWTSSSSVSSLPATLTGTLANFVTGETATFRLDDPSTGTLLTGSTSPSSIPANGAATFSVTIPVGTSCGAHVVYAVGSSGSQASKSIGVIVNDITPPAVSSAVIDKGTGNASGFIRQGGQYYVLANVSDPGTCASGVATVAANASAITTGSTSIPLTAGSFTAGGVSYGYRSNALTANAVLSSGSKAFSITATDVAGNTTNQGGFSVTVDNTPPTATDVQTTNVAGGTNGIAETGDAIVYTFSEPMDPGSILAGWNGSSTTVTLRLTNSSNGDSVTIFNAANTTQLSLGVADLGKKNYATASVLFTGSTMVMSGSTVTVTLGTPSGAGVRLGNSTNIAWTPSSVATDRAGNACSATPVSQSGPARRAF
jgi:hypothetical protein